jgi:hypothetical protein
MGWVGLQREPRFAAAVPAKGLMCDARLVVRLVPPPQTLLRSGQSIWNLARY